MNKPLLSFMDYFHENNLSWRHIQVLCWFANNEGKKLAWSDCKLRDGTIVSSKPKGIYKPKWSACAVSVKKMLKSSYQDTIEHKADGSWYYDYHKEDNSKGESFVNDALIQSMEAKIPVGYLEQVEKAVYEVKGLVLVQSFDGEFFRLKGIKLSEGQHGILGLYLQAEENASNELSDELSFDDQRKREIRYLVCRSGQPKFRRNLIDRYGCCLITGCQVEEVLEAAHIYPYHGHQTNLIENGLLLRSDIHRLFDLCLITISPETLEVLISPSLKESVYYEFHGRKLAFIKNSPLISKKALSWHRSQCGF
jgi:putative restriction endonuclease